MSEAIKRAVWAALDPLLRKIGSRLAHLGVLTCEPDRSDLDRIGTFADTATITRDATVMNMAPRENMSVGGYSVICGGLLISTATGQLRIGHHCTMGQGSRIWVHERVEIGNHVMISHLVDIHDSDEHPLDANHRRAHTIQFCETLTPYDLAHVVSRPVRIEDDAWICFKASILKGVTVGRGAVVAAGAVVTKDVPPFALVAGNPARLVRLLENEDDRARVREMEGAP